MSAAGWALMALAIIAIISSVSFAPRFGSDSQVFRKVAFGPQFGNDSHIVHTAGPSPQSGDDGQGFQSAGALLRIGSNTTGDAGGCRGADVVHVAYRFDPKMVHVVLASWISLASNSVSPHKLCVHILAYPKDVGPARCAVGCLRKELVDRGVETPMTEVLAFTHELQVYEHEVVPWLANYTLLFSNYYLDEYLPGVERVIFLDADTIVNVDLTPLYRHRMRNALAAVLERQSLRAFYWKKMVQKCRQSVRRADKKFFNAGVLLIDLVKWQAKNATTRLNSAYRKCKRMGNQLQLNVVFQRLMFDVLEPGYNSPGESPKLALIAHFKGFYKPWNASHVDFTTDFWLHSKREMAGDVIHETQEEYEAGMWTYQGYTQRLQCDLGALCGRSHTEPG